LHGKGGINLSENLLIGLTSILVLGIFAEWLAWRLRVPSILLLLIFGFVAGPITGFLKPEELIGDLSFPLVSLAVAVILYEGGLSLKIKELREVGGVVRRLISVGALVTWLVSSAAAYLFVTHSFQVAILLGAILVVTGPTVIVPLLNHVRPVGQVGPILKWEGIVIDPIGATLAVLVFEAILSGKLQTATTAVLAGVAKTVLVGGSFGILAALLLLLLLRKFLIPDYLQNPFSLMMVLLAATAADLLQEESGLVSATVMGVVLANQKTVAVRHIIAFEENLRVLLISALFIFLAARLQIADFRPIGFSSVAFLAVLFFVARPLSVLVSTAGSSLTWQERLFLSWLAPRGIVAASVATIFALRLEEIGYTNGNLLVSYTFLVIAATVTVYGLTTPFLARRLGLSNPNPQGTLILGAHSWAREIGRTLSEEGIQVLLVDVDRRDILRARMAGLPTFQAHILSEHFLDEVELAGIGRILAITPNDEMNSFAAIHMQEVFGRAEVYQLLAEGEEEERKKIVAHHLHGRHLFGWGMTYAVLDKLFESGAKLKKSRLTEEFDYQSYQAHYGQDAIPLFLIDKNKSLSVFTIDNEPVPKPGQTLISLVKNPDARGESDSSRQKAPAGDQPGSPF